MMGLKVNVVGGRELHLRLRGSEKRLKALKPLFLHLNQKLVAHYAKNMSSGVAADGSKLPQVERWTREFRRGVGKNAGGNLTPLLATGGMRNSIGAVEITDKRLVFGFRGFRFPKRAERMTDGRGAWMPVKKQRIRGVKAGNPHIRVRTNAGAWRTKRVVNGAVFVRPKARRFFYISNRQAKIVGLETNKWMKKRLFSRRRK